MTITSTRSRASRHTVEYVRALEATLESLEDELLHVSSQLESAACDFSLALAVANPIDIVNTAHALQATALNASAQLDSLAEEIGEIV